MPHKSSPRTLEITDPSWGQWWSTGTVHVKCTGPLQRAAAASPTPTPATVSEQPWLPYSFSEQRVCLLQFRESWGLPLEFSFFFSVSSFNLLLVCVGGGWGTLPQYPCGGQRTPSESQFSPSTLGSGDGIQVTRPVNKHRTILPASMDLYWAHGSKSIFVHKYDV